MHRLGRLLLVQTLWIHGQGWEPLRDSLVIENERIETLDLSQRPLPALPELSPPTWPALSFPWEKAPAPALIQPAILAPTRPSWTKLAPLHLRYGIGRFWTQLVEATWTHTRDLERDGGIAFSHFSTPQGHVPLARWGYSTLQAWIGHTTATSGWEARYQGSFEKFFFYAPYAEKWYGFSENTPAQDSLKGHYGRQELSLSGWTAKSGQVSLHTRRLDFRQGPPEWQGEITWQSPSYKLPYLGQGTTHLRAFLEGKRFLFSGTSVGTYTWGPWLIRGGLQVALAKDSTLRFFTAPHLLALYQGISPSLCPYIELKGDMRPLTYYTASELNPYLHRATGILPFAREWLTAEVGLRGQGTGWDYRLAAEYRYAQNLLRFQPMGARFGIAPLPTFQSLGALVSFTYTPQATGPYAELQAAYRKWYLPPQTPYYSVAPWELSARGGYQWENHIALFLRLYALGPRFLTDSLQAPTFVDISWEAHVRLWPFLSFFVQMNNLLNQRFYRWYGYRERPLDIRIGLWTKIG